MVTFIYIFPFFVFVCQIIFYFVIIPNFKHIFRLILYALQSYFTVYFQHLNVYLYTKALTQVNIS